jgi:hypothetical protein
MCIRGLSIHKESVLLTPPHNELGAATLLSPQHVSQPQQFCGDLWWKTLTITAFVMQKIFKDLFGGFFVVPIHGQFVGNARVLMAQTLRVRT